MKRRRRDEVPAVTAGPAFGAENLLQLLPQLEGGRPTVGGSSALVN
ncbi:MAG: hypothetical protein O2931_01230 [Planctomycetota bacterium]|nr:hypothetical protein [Planctomycetota bacterium]MDA1177395.1 hypothetical protein [Planctomycetota bacterium]